MRKRDPRNIYFRLKCKHIRTVTTKEKPKEGDELWCRQCDDHVEVIDTGINHLRDP